MQINIKPIVVNGVVCTKANVYVAVSSSVAVRVVPVDDLGTEYPDDAIGITGQFGDPAIQNYMDDITAATTSLLFDRGI